MRKKKITTGFEDIKIIDPKDKEKIYNSHEMDSRCPRGLTCMPSEPCPMALNTIYQQGMPQERCEWSVVHGDSNYCFFVYQRFNNRAHTLDEIASLLNSTITSVDLQAKRAMEKIKKKFKTERDFIKASEDTDDGEIIP